MVRIDELFGNPKLMEVLSYFLTHPTEEISQTSLINKTGISKATAVKWVGSLVLKELLIYKKVGRTHLYRLNNNKPLVKQLKVLNAVAQLQELKVPEGTEPYLYGSAARGEDSEDSDIDIIIIGKCKREQVVNGIDQISKNIRRKINFTIFTEIEWSKMHKNDKPFYERVEKDKISLR
ncbi:MAG: nucleotidyltransferase domain-containing protein [Candidatus Woesearchaeota archaeon]